MTRPWSRHVNVEETGSRLIVVADHVDRLRIARVEGSTVDREIAMDGAAAGEQTTGQIEKAGRERATSIDGRGTGGLVIVVTREQSIGRQS